MPQIFPVPNCEHEDGFSLVEVIVATAIVALMVSAAASTVAVARMATTASEFLHAASSEAETIQAADYGFAVEDRAASLESEREIINRDAAESVPAWRLYTLRPVSGERRAMLALEAVGLP